MNPTFEDIQQAADELAAVRGQLNTEPADVAAEVFKRWPELKAQAASLRDVFVMHGRRLRLIGLHEMWGNAPDDWKPKWTSKRN